MKTVSALLIMIVLVAGIAVSGSRAAQVTRFSPVMDRCLSIPEGGGSYLCQPMLQSLQARIDGDYLGDADVGAADLGAASMDDASVGDSIDPERRWGSFLHVVAAIVEAAANLFDQLSYGSLNGPVALHSVDELFDTGQ